MKRERVGGEERKREKNNFFFFFCVCVFVPFSSGVCAAEKDKGREGILAFQGGERVQKTKMKKINGKKNSGSGGQF